MTGTGCPRCGYQAIWDYSCHTYGQGDRFMTCAPCDSATRWICSNDDCDWEYEHGLNPRNPRAVDNETRRPAWLPDDDHERHRQPDLFISRYEDPSDEEEVTGLPARCCDLHGRNCEPPADLCCSRCTEAVHQMGDAAVGVHLADGSACANPDLSGPYPEGNCYCGGPEEIYPHRYGAGMYCRGKAG